jgi:hypothetical protein
MELPGRDVTADPLGPDTETPRIDTPERVETRPADRPAAEGDEDEKGIADKLREAADKVKDAVTPDDRQR